MSLFYDPLASKEDCPKVCHISNKEGVSASIRSGAVPEKLASLVLVEAARPAS
jgi:hypothetical protein